jgi:hypothetical protein
LASDRPRAALVALHHESATKLQAVLADREATAKTLAAALLEYEEALDLLGDRRPRESGHGATSLQEDFKDHRVALQSFANTLVEDYDAAFRRSVARAAGPTFPDLQECRRRSSRARCRACRAAHAEPGLRRRNLNQTFATAVDADPDLAHDLDEVLARAVAADVVSPRSLSP